MDLTDIKRHLKEYRIHDRRRTTINHAFAAAIAPCDEFDKEKTAAAVRLLDQDPDRPLSCVYCDGPAETWDHVFATVKDSTFSGAGHRLGNLLPCCKPCNSSKGNKPWRDFVNLSQKPEAARRIERIERYLTALYQPDELPFYLPEYQRLTEIRQKILALMREADEVAATLRSQMKLRKASALS